MNSLGAREDMNSDFEGSSFRVVQTIEQTKFCSADSTLKEVSDMATEQKRNEKLHAPNIYVTIQKGSFSKSFLIPK